MEEYHRGFDDAMSLVEGLAIRHLANGRGRVRPFIREAREIRERVTEHKVVELRDQMGL